MVAVAGGGADGYRGDQQLFPCGSRSQALERSLFLREDDVSLDRDWMGLSICIGLAVGAVSSLQVPFWC